MRGLVRGCGTAILSLLVTACGSRPATAQQAVHVHPAAASSAPGTITINQSVGETR
jgi:hypothetical protein